MQRLAALITLLTFTLSYAADTAPVNLPYTLELARQHLASREIDSATCVNIAIQLKRGAEYFPESSIAPEALQTAWKLAQFCKNSLLAVQCSEQCLKQSPQSPFTDEAFDNVWNYLTNSGNDAAVGADFARQSAEALQDDPRSARFWVNAFQGYTAAGRWKDAEQSGEKFLQAAGQPAADPLVYLTMADVALSAGNSNMCRQATDSFLKLFPKLPHVVNAHLQLGRYHEANGNRTAARSSYNSAWNIYDKNKNKQGYSDQHVRRAAAEALWALQRDARDGFDKAVGAQTSDFAFLKREADKLLQNYEKCVHTSSEYGAQAFSEMGHICAALASIYAERGLDRASRAEQGTNLRLLLADAIEINQRAISYLHNAEIIAASTESDNPDRARELRAAATFAAERAYELTWAQGEWLYSIAAIADDRIKNQSNLKSSALDRCLDWKQNVVPLALEGFERKCDALRNAAVANIFLPENNTAADKELRATVNAQLVSGTEFWSRTASSAIQVASSVQIGLRTSSGTEMFESNQRQFEQSAQLSNALIPEVARILELVRARGDAGIDLTLWEDLAGRANADYAGSCATIQKHLNPALEKLSSDYTTTEGAIRKNLATLAAHAAQEEYKTLVAFHKLAQTNQLASTRSRDLLERLAAMDPQKYGIALPDASASRKNP